LHEVRLANDLRALNADSLAGIHGLTAAPEVDLAGLVESARTTDRLLEDELRRSR
jgi:hypothetical protein